MRAGWIRPSETSFSSVIRPTSRRTGSKQDSSTASGVSSMIRLTPVTASKARMLRPSRPMIRPFMSSDGNGRTATVEPATLLVHRLVEFAPSRVGGRLTLLQAALAPVQRDQLALDRFLADEKALLSALDLQKSVSCLTLSLRSKPCRFLLRGLATLQRRVSRLHRCFSLRSLGLPTCVIQDRPCLLLRRTEQTGRLFPLVDRAHGEAHDDANEDSHDDAGQHNGLLCAPPGRNVQPVQGRWAWPPTIGPLERQ